MTFKFSTKERKAFAEMSLDQLVDATRAAGVNRVGANSRFLLTEFALRLDIPTDSISLAIVRTDRKAVPAYGWHWGIYAEDKVEKLRALPNRRWDSYTKSNSFTASGETDPAVFGLFDNLYSKTVVIGESGYRIDTGTVVPQWSKPVLYAASTEPFTVNLGNVLNGFFKLRPSDAPRSLALHGEIDEKYRTFFDDSLPADADVLSGINLQTRHPTLLFRLSQFDGKARYLSYSAEKDVPIEIAFAGSKRLGAVLAQFKETQQRLTTPLIEKSWQGALKPTGGSKPASDEPSAPK